MQNIYLPGKGWASANRPAPVIEGTVDKKTRYKVETSLGIVTRTSTRSDYRFVAVWGMTHRFVKGGTKDVIDASFHGSFDAALKSRPPNTQGACRSHNIVEIIEL